MRARTKQSAVETSIRNSALQCSACRADVETPVFTMAFQPIVDIEASKVFAYEALVRPIGGGSALTVLGQVTDANRYSFDQACRTRAIELAAKLGMPCFLSINFLPNAVYQAAACIRQTVQAARENDFPLHHIIFEVTEDEQSRDPAHLKSIFTEYKRRGMMTAIDDFGAGHSGLSLLAEFQPDIIKVDMALTRDINRDVTRQAITRGIISIAHDLGISVVAEGVESLDEARALRDLGIKLFQGYLFARPGLEQLPRVSLLNLP